MMCLPQPASIPMRLVDHAALTDVGLRRELNEDNFAQMPEFGIWAVADGMGGHEGGEIASQMTKDEIMEGARLRRPLVETIKQAHQEIMQHPMAGGDRGMGTTVVALHAHFDTNTIEIAWVGDSRAYVLDETGLHQRSKDHALVQEWVDDGLLTEQEARYHPHRNIISQALGIEQGKPMRVDTWSAPISGRTRVLLCSDGLTEHVEDGHLKLLLGASSCQQAAQDLVQAALDGGGSDNITVIVVDLDVG